MQAFAPGTVLSGRYRLDEHLGTIAGAERWNATDESLERVVVVLALPASDDRGPALLDAARRAAGVASPLLANILDVGRDEEATYVVEEALTGEPTLAAIVAEGTLPGDEVRRITGEIGTVLESARQRGLHHLTLTPEDVVRTGTGDIKVRGLATGAALTGADELPPAEADHEDAVGLVALAYAGLTGMWPLRDRPTSLPAPPRTDGRPAPPTQLAAGVPRDLDTLCRLTLDDGAEGPVSPGDYARQIAPWPVRNVAARRAEADSEAMAEAAAVAAGPDRDEEQPSADGAQATQEVPAAPAPVVAPTTAAPPPVVPAAPPLVPAAPPAAPTPSASPPLDGAEPRTVGAMARRAADKATSLAEAAVTHMGTQEDGTSRPAPLVPAEPLNRRQSSLALGIVAAAILVALAFAIPGVMSIGSSSAIFDTPVLTTSPSPSTAKSSGAPGSTAASPSPSLEVLAILGADGFDPLGDGKENNALAAKVYDEDTATSWRSEGYRSASFGGLKAGTGVIVDLGPNKDAQRITLALPVVEDVEVYLANARSLDGAKRVGTKAAAKGTVSFDVPAAARGQYVIVWFTTVPLGSDGRYRAYLSEVTVLG